MPDADRHTDARAPAWRNQYFRALGTGSERLLEMSQRSPQATGDGRRHHLDQVEAELDGFGGELADEPVLFVIAAQLVPERRGGDADARAARCMRP